jgi:sirohydrochlorin cobaltochelatase
MGLTWRRDSAHHHAGSGETGVGLRRRAAQLDATIRRWPRHAGNDPYKTGLERVAEALRPLLPAAQLAVAYNEFCQPTIAEAIDHVIQGGARRVVVLPSMLTPGGVHAEEEIPRALEEIRRAHPGIRIDYVWPFDLGELATLLASHITRALELVA